MERFDAIVIGAGMAGASAAAALAGAGATVLLLEGEDQPGRHATGRSAAFFAETYGGPDVQPLTTGSKAFFSAPADPAFGEAPLVTPRGALHVAWAGQEAAMTAMVAAFRALSPGVTTLDRAGVLARVPMLRPDGVIGGVWDPDCQDIDVGALHGGFLRQFRRAGGVLRTSAPVAALAQVDGGWQVGAAGQALAWAPLIVNAAGAWADAIATLAGEPPLGLVPCRRTIIVFEPEPAFADPQLPLVLDLAEQFYFKPDAGRIWASPADETPSPACDVRPEELDIAITADRIQRATVFAVPRILRAWAGLRTFTPDRAPALGFGRRPGFFWCAGQGGFGIQTAPAAGRLVAALALGQSVPGDLAALGITPMRYSPLRFAAG